MLSIVIPTKNGGERFRQLLDAVRAQEIGEPVEIVVVDSGSSDGSDALARHAGALLRRIPAGAFSHGGAHNLGAAAASGEVLVFLSQDAVPEHDRWLASLVAPLRDDDSIAAVYGRQLPFPEVAPPERYFLGFLYGPRARTQRLNGNADLSMDTTLFSNANSAIRRSVWERIRFSEDILMAEDQEWAVRVLQEGRAIRYEPSASVRHSHAYTIRSAFRRFFDSGATADQTYLAGAGRANRTLHRNALRYARGEIAWLWRSGHKAWIPYTVVYELSKYAGLALGRQHRRLPARLKRRLSAAPSYWAATEGRSPADVD